ncbi:hypothetical protein [Bacillus spizizenii]|nr:hypothetical protein [Bacillus spizizenii]MEC1526491.1 hypothetical protein [Bacillus spizizenii]
MPNKLWNDYPLSKMWGIGGRMEMGTSCTTMLMKLIYQK